MHTQAESIICGVIVFSFFGAVSLDTHNTAYQVESIKYCEIEIEDDGHGNEPTFVEGSRVAFLKAGKRIGLASDKPTGSEQYNRSINQRYCRLLI